MLFTTINLILTIRCTQGVSLNSFYIMKWWYLLYLDEPLPILKMFWSAVIGETVDCVSTALSILTKSNSM